MAEPWKQEDKCCYCGKDADGAMLAMGNKIAHAPCAIQELNELLDPDFDGSNQPEQIVGFIQAQIEQAKKEERERILKILRDPECGLLCAEEPCHACQNFFKALKKVKEE